MREKELVHGDASRVVKWIEGEVEAFDDLLSSLWSMLALGLTTALLKTVGCEHVKAIS